MHDLLNKRIAIAYGANFNATDASPAAKLEISRPVPIDVYRWGIITDELMDPDAGGFQIDLVRLPTFGDAAGEVVVQSIVRADTETVPAGTVLYVDTILPVAQAVAEDGSLRDVEPAGPLRVAPGEGCIIRVSNAVGAASTGAVWAEFVEHGFQDKAGDDVVKDT